MMMAIAEVSPKLIVELMGLVVAAAGTGLALLVMVLVMWAVAL